MPPFLCRLSYEASQVQTNTRDQESRGNSNRAFQSYGNSREIQNERALLLAHSIPELRIIARLVAPPMLSDNHAGTGTAARAIGVALGVSAARIAARSQAAS